MFGKLLGNKKMGRRGGRDAKAMRRNGIHQQQTFQKSFRDPVPEDVYTSDVLTESPPGSQKTNLWSFIDGRPMASRLEPKFSKKAMVL